jgi:hypothetical protein
LPNTISLQSSNEEIAGARVNKSFPPVVIKIPNIKTFGHFSFIATLTNVILSSERFFYRTHEANA